MENNSTYYLTLKSREKPFRYKDLIVKTGNFLHWDIYGESSPPGWNLHWPKHIYHESTWMKFLYFLFLYMPRTLPHRVSFPHVGQGLGPKIKTQSQLEGTKSVTQGGTLIRWPTGCGLTGTFPVLVLRVLCPRNPLANHSIFWLYFVWDLRQRLEMGCINPTLILNNYLATLK